MFSCYILHVGLTPKPTAIVETYIANGYSEAYVSAYITLTVKRDLLSC